MYVFIKNWLIIVFYISEGFKKRKFFGFLKCWKVYILYFMWIVKRFVFVEKKYICNIFKIFFLLLIL